MQFELIDAYLLGENADKGELIRQLVAAPADVAAARAFYEGMRMLGARTPDLSLVALRLVLAGKKADDERVVALRRASEAVRAGGEGAPGARQAYFALLSPDS